MPRPAGLRLLIVALLLAAPTAPTLAEPEEDRRRCHALEGDEICIGEADYTRDVCRAIERLAIRNGLPEGFFARLIWQESRFDPTAISPVGAQGIAQFMPGTARLRALGDPFDPAEALARSAEYLAFLNDKFGNLGLAAAAYNGGEGRMSRYVAQGGGLPLETRDYVRIITGRSVEHWRAETPEPADYTLDPERPFEPACIEMARAVPMPEFGPTPGEWQPWGVLLAQHFSREQASGAFERVRDRHQSVLGQEKLMLITVRNPSFGTRQRFSAMVGRQTREEAQALCTALTRSGGTCIVQRNGE
ncbi:lytic transglycosylase domain-containing protein [Arsenicitalea aurantiaca]|nr:lytic transglycosylase domain-containing protein [Arsenicitalea aurantiaca]